MTDKIEAIDLRFAEDAIPEDVFASIPQYLNVRTYVARAFARHRQSSSAVGDAGLRKALADLIEYADLMPKKTPAAGGCSTIHQFEISAGAIWGLDERVKKARAALQSQPGAVTGDARPWQPWERNFSGGRVGVQEQQGANENWMILHVESGGAKTTTSLRMHEAWDLALMISPEVKRRLDELLQQLRAANSAVHSLTNRDVDTALLRQIADEQDCGANCDYASNSAAPCPRAEGDGCHAYDAESLRELAKAIDLGAALAAGPQGEEG